MLKRKKILFLLSMASLSMCDISYASQKKEEPTKNQGQRKEEPSKNKGGWGSDMGANAGEESSRLWIDAIDRWGGAGAAAALAAGPYILGGVAVAGGAYGGYKVYRHFRPTEEEQFAQKARIEEHKRKAQDERARGFLAAESGDSLAHRLNFKKCLSNNPMARRNSIGIPTPCADSARNLALFSGEREVMDITKTFEKFSRPPSR